jgi:phosphoglycerate dehydrogenase-like enzyme
MTRLMFEPNKTLKGHKLLVLSPMPVEPRLVNHVKARFPDLDIVCHQAAWGIRDTYKIVPEEEWKDVTILVSGTGMPHRDQAPKLQYVQLFSAGANHILDLPLFKETDIVFCTANGVHGYVHERGSQQQQLWCHNVPL